MLLNGKPLLVYKQNDAPHALDVLGFSQDRPTVGAVLGRKARTLGGYGCAVASIATATALAPVRLTPREVNERGKLARGFAANSGNMILERLAASAGLCAPESLRVRECDQFHEDDLLILRETIRLSLSKTDPERFFEAGGFCLLNVDYDHDLTPEHFTLAVAALDDGSLEVADPAPGAMINIDATMHGTSTWSSHNVKHYTVIGAAPIGLVRR